MFHCPKDEWTKGSRAFFNCKIRSKETNLIDQYWKGSVRSIYDVLLAYCMYQWHIVPLAYFGGLPVVHCTSGISCGACDLQRRYQINCVMPELNQPKISVSNSVQPVLVVLVPVAHCGGGWAAMNILVVTTQVDVPSHLSRPHPPPSSHYITTMTRNSPCLKNISYPIGL